MTLLDSFSGPADPTNGPGMGIPGFFVFFFVLVLGIGIVGTIVRVTSARSMARRAGLDPDDASAVTLLSPQDGLAATYLASNLRPAAPAAAPAGKSTAQRLAELEDLHRSGAISSEEHAAQRARILGTV
ncbi:MAG: SHOCT domain-containing protein [Marmoricola sp.]